MTDKKPEANYTPDVIDGSSRMRAVDKLARRGIALASDLERADASAPVEGLSGAAIDLGPGLSLPPEIVTETLAILANRGAGKSACARRLVEQMHFAGLPVVVIDVKGDWWGIRSSADGIRPGLPFVIFGGDHHDVALEPTAGELLADLVVDDRIPAVLDLSHMSKTKARQFATAFAERLYARNRDPLHVVIEEADVLVPQRVSSDTARLIGAMEDLGKRGRSRGLGLTLVSQRPQEVSKSLLDLMETVVLLRMTGPRSIKAVQEWISVNADANDTAASDVIGSLPALATGEGWVWSPSFLRLMKRVQFAMFSTFDSHATPRPGQPRLVPQRRADIDLKRLGAEIAATVERARENDPAELRNEVREQRRLLTAAEERARTSRAELDEGYQRQLADRDRTIAELRDRIRELENRPPRYPAEVIESLGSAAQLIRAALGAMESQSAASRRPASTPEPDDAAPPPATPPQPATTPFSSPSENGDERPQFRAGARRMIESLARMAPMRLTKAQWAMVARMSHKGGTWSTYLGELRHAGYIDESDAGFTLTDNGFSYLGARPEPMTATELQQHYLGILRLGAARMLQAVIDAYPTGISRKDLAAAAGIVVTGGTFSTYLGELRRNGLVEQRGDELVATEILIRGASAGSV